MQGRRAFRIMAAAAVVVLGTTACLRDPGSGGIGRGGGGDDTVEVMYGFSGDQSRNFQAAVNAWAQKTGIKVKLSSTPDFDKLVRSRVAGNNVPDIAIFPQPGITLDIGQSGKLIDLNTVLDRTKYTDESMYLYDAASDESGRVFALPFSTSVKSLVWYPKQPFEAAGGASGSRARRPPDGRPPTGPRTTCCASAAATGTGSGSPTRSRSTIRSSSRR
jgi:alpha-glucoside transport system substrate-binding protein